MTETVKLFSPYSLRGVTLSNRIVISPMCQYSAHEGYLDTWHKIHLGRFVMGGAGLIFTEATAVQKSGRITHGCPGLWEDGQVGAHAEITSFARTHGAVSAIQLAHAGRKGGMQRPWYGNSFLTEADHGRGDHPWIPFGPSPVPVDNGWPVPHEMTLRDIEELRDDFVAATKRAVRAGYDVLEVHGAHGYLIHSFLSPLSNHRSDAYGGSLQNRMRLALEISEAVRAVWPDDLPLFFRVSAVDGSADGWKIEDTVHLAKALKAVGVDVIDCSSGGISGSATAGNSGRRQPGFQVPFASRVKEGADMATMAVGLITHAKQAEMILKDNQADLIAIGREALANPNWSWHARQALNSQCQYHQWPEQSGWWLERRQQSCDFYSDGL